MITELGHFALILAFGVAIVQMVVPLVGAHKRWPGWMAVAEPAAGAQFALPLPRPATTAHWLRALAGASAVTF